MLALLLHHVLCKKLLSRSMPSVAIIYCLHPPPAEEVMVRNKGFRNLQHQRDPMLWQCGKAAD